MQKKNKLLVGLLILISLYGLLLRGYQIGSASLWIDEGASVRCAQGIVEKGVPAVSDANILWDGFPYHYLIAIPIGLLTDYVGTTRFLSALLGCVLIISQYELVKKCSNSTFAAVFSAFLTAFMTYEIAWCRQIRFYVFLQLVLVIGTRQAVEFFAKRRILSLIGSVICLVLAVFIHRSGYILGMFLGVMSFLYAPEWICSLFFRKTKQNLSRSKRHEKWHIWSIVILFLAFVTFIISLFLIRSNSSPIDTLEMLLQSSGTDYVWMYLLFLYEQFGWTVLLIPLGIVFGIYMKGRVFIALGITVVAYFYVISVRTWLFAFRYLLPIFPFLIVFLSQNLAFGEKITGKMGTCLNKRTSFLKTGVCSFLVIITVPFISISYFPAAEYSLGYTAPQPRWEEAFALILEREERMSGKGTEITTVSAFPMFHDIYLGKKSSNKYYIPVSHTGYAEQIQPKAPYSDAETIESLEQLLALDGYLVLDDFSKKMLVNKEIRDWAETNQYNALIKGRFNIYIWIL